MSQKTVSLGVYRISIDEKSGLVTGLSAHEGPDALGHGAARSFIHPSVAYEKKISALDYEGMVQDGEALRLSYTQGPLRLVDDYRLAGGLLERRVTLTNISSAELQITGLEVGFAGVLLGEAGDCLFEAPANAVRPRLPLAQVPERDYTPAALKAFAPGASYVWNAGINDAPDFAPGLLVLRNPALGWQVMTWYFSEVEAARPLAFRSGGALDFSYQLWLAGWLKPGESLTGGPVCIALSEGSYEDALGIYRGEYDRLGITPPLYGEVDQATDWVAVYEAHPGQFGGFNGMKSSLRALQQMGFDTLYLLPIYPYRNKTGQPWDTNWEKSGSVYAIHDFQKLEPSLGPEGLFRALVEAAHALGMKVLVDLVLQGCSLESAYTTDHPDWFVRDENGLMVHSHGWNDTWSFDWANPDYQRFVIDYATDMVKRYDIDGFRVDAPHGKEPNWARDLPYHASKTNLGTANLLADLAREIRAIKNGAALYCELFGPMWLRSHAISNDYHPHAMAYAMGFGQLSPREFGDYLKDYWQLYPAGTPRICFTETHDTRSFPASPLRGSRLSRALMGALVMAGFTPMVWSGQEVGQEDFFEGLLLARRRNRVLRRGERLFNAIGIDDMDHYRRGWGEPPQDQVFATIIRDEKTALFGVVSFCEEKASYRFSLPVDDLPIDPAKDYVLRDLITYDLWLENGKETWKGEELRSFILTPEMITPYIFRIEEVPTEG